MVKFRRDGGAQRLLSARKGLDRVDDRREAAVVYGVVWAGFSVSLRSPVQKFREIDGSEG